MVAHGAGSSHAFEARHAAVLTCPQRCTAPRPKGPWPCRRSWWRRSPHRPPQRAASYPPEYRFRTITTEHVSVHFHQGDEAMAREAAAIADEILALHEARYGTRVGRVQLVLVDSDDLPNGFASPLPYPLVTIRAVSPDGSDDFGNHEGWLRLVLTHELAHSVHLEQARGAVARGPHAPRPRAVPVSQHVRDVAG